MGTLDSMDQNRRDIENAGRGLLLTGIPFTIGLTFAVLGLGMETFDRYGSTFMKWVEVVSWAILLASGIAGIGWLHFAPNAYMRLHQAWTDTALASRYFWWSERCSWTHRGGLILGLVCLAIARAVGAFSAPPM